MKCFLTATAAATLLIAEVANAQLSTIQRRSLRVLSTANSTRSDEQAELDLPSMSMGSHFDIQIQGSDSGIAVSSKSGKSGKATKPSAECTTYASPEDVFEFWFQDHSEADWFTTNTTFDEEIRDRFLCTLLSASAVELDTWRTNAEGALAEIVVLDQFSRNLYRNTAQAFAQDGVALALAQEAIAKGFDQELETVERGFLYLPFMHSESKVIHERAMVLFDVPGLESRLEYEILHRDAILRFGRYPTRNKALGRKSTPEEVKYLKEGGRF